MKARLQTSRNHFALLILILALAFGMFTSKACAQTSTPTHRFTFNFGAGVTPWVGDLSNRLDTGWHVTLGGGYNFNSHFSLIGEYMYNGFGVQNVVLREANVPAANAHMHVFTVDPVVHFNPGGRFDPYAIGGVGYYRRRVNFTMPTTATTLFFDPFFGLFVPEVVPADTLLGSVVRDGFGGNIGGGVNIPVGSTGAKFYVEARYHAADTGRVSTQMVPVTFGVRW